MYLLDQFGSQKGWCQVCPSIINFYTHCLDNHRFRTRKFFYSTGSKWIPTFRSVLDNHRFRSVLVVDIIMYSKWIMLLVSIIFEMGWEYKKERLNL